MGVTGVNEIQMMIIIHLRQQPLSPARCARLAPLDNARVFTREAALTGLRLRVFLVCGGGGENTFHLDSKRKSVSTF